MKDILGEIIHIFIHFIWCFPMGSTEDNSATVHIIAWHHLNPDNHYSWPHPASLAQGLNESTPCELSVLIVRFVDKNTTGIWKLNMSNSLAPGRYGSTSKIVISKQMSWIKFQRAYYEIALRWMPENTFDGKSTLCQIMAWCHQATSHYLSQCCPSSVLHLCHH